MIFTKSYRNSRQVGRGRAAQGEVVMAGANELYAYAGLTLRVNLSNGAVRTEPTLPYAREWLGSTGIAIKILYDELRSWVTPYDPANKIVFGTGALVGTPAPGACKMSASTLGPRTGAGPAALLTAT